MTALELTIPRGGTNWDMNRDAAEKQVLGHALRDQSTAEWVAKFPENFTDIRRTLADAIAHHHRHGVGPLTNTVYQSYLREQRGMTPREIAALTYIYHAVTLRGAGVKDTDIHRLQSELVAAREVRERKRRAGELARAGNIADAMPLLEGVVDPKASGQLRQAWAEKLRREGGELIEVNWDAVGEEVRWLWEGRIPMESLTLIAGVGGLGKSTVTLDLAAMISTGRDFPDGSAVDAGDVLLFSAEDSPKVLKGRLKRQGANLSRIHLVEGQRQAVDGQITERYFTLADIPTLERALDKYPQVKMVVIDPVSAYAVGIDSHKNSDVRVALTPLAKLAESRRVAVVLVCHLNKDGSKSSENRISGSSAWRDLARSAFFVLPDKEDRNRRLFLHEKCNYAPLAAGLAFRFDGNALAWEDTPVDMTVNDAIAALNDAKRETDADAEEYLKSLLTASGRASSKDVIEGGKQQGISDYRLYKAAKRLGVTIARDGFRGRYIWSLPLPETGTPADPQGVDESPF